MGKQSVKRTGIYLTGVLNESRVLPWERQPGETDEAFTAFTVYLTVREENMGGKAETARRLGCSEPLITRWSQRWKWDERHRAWENNNLLLQERARQDAIRKEAGAWAKRRINIREEGYTAGEAMMERARALLALPVANKEVKDEILITSDMVGQVLETVTVLNFEQHPRDARMLAESAVKLMRLSADMSTENIAMAVKDTDITNLSEEELDTYANQLLELRQKSLGGD